MTGDLPLGMGATSVALPLSLVNRHMLVSGSTGSGKTVSLLGIVARLSSAGVPVLFPDVKGDVGILSRCSPCRVLPAISFEAWRVESDTVARALGLTATQSAALAVAWEVGRRDPDRFRTLDHVRSTLVAIGNNPRSVADIGHVSPASLSVASRALLQLERAGGRDLFGETTFDVARLLETTETGQGFVTILDAMRLAREGSVYSVPLLFVLDELFDRLPEVGDLDRPRLVVVLDEAHLVFDGATDDVVRSIACKVRLIRSKGVGLVFSTQFPGDLPTEITAQLGTRVQHGLRAADAATMRTVRAAVDSMPGSAGRNLSETVRTMPTGSALVSTLQRDGTSSRAVVVKMHPPSCSLSPLPPEDWAALPRLTATEQPAEPEQTVEPGALPVFLSLGMVIVGLYLLLSVARYAIG